MILPNNQNCKYSEVFTNNKGKYVFTYFGDKSIYLDGRVEFYIVNSSSIFDGDEIIMVYKTMYGEYTPFMMYVREFYEFDRNRNYSLPFPEHLVRVVIINILRIKLTLKKYGIRNPRDQEEVDYRVLLPLTQISASFRNRIINSARTQQASTNGISGRG